MGRAWELAELAQCTEAEGPSVTFLYGLGGMGKSALVEVLGEALRTRGVRVLSLDARHLEPTPSGFWHALGAQLGVEGEPKAAEAHADGRAARVLAALADTPGPSVLVVDHCELLRLIDAWLRNDFVPRLPTQVRLVMAGRHPPSAGWSTSAGWQTLVKTYALQALDEADARAFLERRRAPAALVPAILSFAQGHPLSLELALAAAAERPGFDFEAPDRARVTARLAQVFLQDLADPNDRVALEATAVVRRASRSFLTSLLGAAAAVEAMEHLGELGFVERTPEGLSLHPTVRQALEGELRALDPIRHRELRRAAWQHMRRALPSVGRAHVWQHAADALYLLEQAPLREAFFPSSREAFVVERARDGDWPQVAAIAESYDSAVGVAAIEASFRHAPDTVHVARSESGEVVCFYVLARSDRVREPVLAADALIARWVEHQPASEAPALLLRRLLPRPTPATRAESYAACVLDLKRTYIENPNTTRLYAATSDPDGQPEWGPLGFREQPGLSVAGLARDGGPHSTFCLEFGAGGIFGWIRRLVDAQYEAPQEPSVSNTPPALGSQPSSGLYLDEAQRLLLVDGAAVTLTPLQYNLLRHLSKYPAEVLEREKLIEAVWGRSSVGSNVVDASVRSLRKKLGRYAHAIETVKGFGYRFRATAKPV